MGQTSSSIQARQAWNAVSRSYLDGRLQTQSIDYGPFCPLEEDIQLIASLAGDLRNLNVLDAGCGSGTNAVVFAQHGAQVTALDFSKAQLSHAQKAAMDANVDVRFLLGDVETLESVGSATQHLVLCSHVLSYVEHVDRALASCRRVLRQGGYLVLSMDHPIRTCFFDAETSELTNYPERSYFDTALRTWTFDDTGAIMRSFDRPISEWIDQLRTAHLSLVRLLEPPTPTEIRDEFFAADGPLASLRNIPHTLLLVATPSESDT